MNRKRTTKPDFDFESFDEDRVLLDLDDLDQDEQDCLAALAGHDGRAARDRHDEY